MLWLVLSVALWGLAHSWLATTGFKAWFARAFGETGERFYRLGYNLFSFISLLPTLWLWWALPDAPLYRIPPPWTYLTGLGQLLAGFALLVGVLQTDAAAFLGLRQLFEGGRREEPFITQGLYRWVRHPLYTAGLLFIWLVPVVSVNTLVLMVSASLYLVVGAHFEERKLARQFGQAYAVYKARTPMLIPGLRVAGIKSPDPASME